MAHDYPIDKKDTVIALNELISKTETLLSIYEGLKERYMFFDNTDYWNMDAEYLQPLKEFLWKCSDK